MKILKVIHKGKTGTVIFEDGSEINVKQIKAEHVRPLRFTFITTEDEKVELTVSETYDFIKVVSEVENTDDLGHWKRFTENTN